MMRLQTLWERPWPRDFDFSPTERKSSGASPLPPATPRFRETFWLRNCFINYCLALLLSFSAVFAHAAEAERAATPDTVTLNFVNADIEGVVKAVGEITGKNFLLDPRVKGAVNIVSAKPMSRALVYDVFLSALRLHGYTAVGERGIIKIVPESDARLHQTPTLAGDGRARAGSDQIQTQVFVLKHESATQLVPVLRPLVSPSNPINASQSGNALVVTDYAGNLQRIEKIIAAIDQPGSDEPVIIPLQYASALDVAQTLNRLFTETAAGAALPADPSQRIMVVPDARSNSLLARAADPARLSRLRQLAAQLDTPTSVGGNIHVVYLKNAEAVKLAETLRAIYQGEGGVAGQPRSTPAANTANPSNTFAGASQSAVTSGIIQADAPTNSIIITAPDAIYNNLRAVVEKLDVRRTQVYVEALIAEITADKAAEFGIQWQDLSGAAKTSSQAFGGTNFGTPSQNIISASQNPALAGQGLNIGVVKGVVSIPGISGQVLNLGLLVRALESDNNANILSTPTLLTLDNEEAKIVIGKNVPFITGQYAVSGAATTPTPFQTVERRDVGVTLRVKPQISDGGTVRLKIFQEVSSVQDSTNAAGVITNKRSIESTVLVDDGQIVVLGGLIQDSLSDGVGKVPLLGDLPLIGGLFSYNTRARNKTNLMVFLRPTVLRDAHNASALSSERYDYILGEQGRAKPAPGTLLPDVTVPGLPPRDLAAPASASEAAAVLR